MAFTSPITCRRINDCWPFGEITEDRTDRGFEIPSDVYNGLNKLLYICRIVGSEY